MKKKSKLLPLLIALILIVFAVRGFSGSSDSTTAETVSDVIDIVNEMSSDTADSVEPAAETEQEDMQEPAQNETGDAETETVEAAETDEAQQDDTEETSAAQSTIDENGSYTTKEDVALYIHTYGHLPSNFVTKKEAEAAGWSGGSVEKYLPGKCIGGSRYGNYEGLLPDAPGRTWTECDINTLGASSRGAERIIFSNDGLIYYTGDHYETFELLYGNP